MIELYKKTKWDSGLISKVVRLSHSKVPLHIYYQMYGSKSI